MAIVNMTQAASMAGIGRTTLYRKVKKGVLSATTMPDGSPGVDTAELFRVFPVKQSGNMPTEQSATAEQNIETHVETALLKQKVEHLEELLSIERRRNEELTQTVRLLEHRTAQAPAAAPPAPRRGFFARLFGGAA